MKKRARWVARGAVVVAAIVTTLSAGCGGGPARTIPLLAAAGIPYTLTPMGEVPLEVVTKSTAIPDPLPVMGTRTYYSDLEPALGHAVSSATVPWADAHRKSNPEGWQLLVELTQAHAEWKDGRLMIALNVRATLRTRVGNTYLAQTHANCSQAGLVAPGDGAPIVFTCMSRIGRDLSGWLGGLAT